MDYSRINFLTLINATTDNTNEVDRAEKVSYFCTAEKRINFREVEVKPKKTASSQVDTSVSVESHDVMNTGLLANSLPCMRNSSTRSLTAILQIETPAPSATDLRDCLRHPSFDKVKGAAPHASVLVYYAT